MTWIFKSFSEWLFNAWEQSTCIMLRNSSQSAQFSCMIVILSFTPKNFFRSKSTSGRFQWTLLSCISVLFTALTVSTSPYLFHALLFCVISFSNITVPAYLNLPGYSILSKLTHSSRAPPCCYSKVPLLKRFTFYSCMVSQIHLHLEKNQRNQFQY